MLLYLIFLVALCILLDRFIFPLPQDSLRKPSATFVYARDRSLLGCFASRDSYWRKPLAVSEISPLLQKSVIACEDRWFYYHPGFNVVSLLSAGVANLKAGRVVRGGSTITMQVARMMEPKPRTIMSKLIEILRAVQLELHYSKREILELYFNLAPYGGNIEGVGAATFFYFGKRPIELTASQAALLTSIPNSPSALRPDINLEKSLRARVKVLGVMLKRRIITAGKHHEALAEEIRPRRFSPSLVAPHFTRDLAIKNPGKPEVISTVDTKIQSLCDGIVGSHKNDLRLRNIDNVAVAVLKNSTGEILAMVGSADFYDIGHQGQVNGALAPRSPGSALKPFVYALALDKGLISPNSILEDLPVYYSGYSPENYDKQFRGAVSAAEALRLSLNVPAVSVCAKVGLGDFCAILKSGGISTLNKKDNQYGLPLILGSCEIKLLDLVTLYSALARDGLYLPFRDEMFAPSSDTLRLFSSAASFIISEILSELQRPDFPSSWEFSPNIPKVAWKTGTSYGRKDAWSIGYNPEYTVGVWVGNFTGEPSPDLVGSEAAAPILFEIFQAISSGRKAGWFIQPQTVGVRQVCSRSGMPPNESCPATIYEMYIPMVSPIKKCSMHKEVLVDSLTSFRLCRFCSEGKHVVHKVYEGWPPKLATWLRNSGKEISVIPGHNPECTGKYAGDKPVIISPNSDVVYIVRDHVPLSLQEIAFEASAASGTPEVYWFIDGELFGRARPGEKLFYIPGTGKHKLTCTDGEGRSSSLTFKVDRF
jgi:penicillin-binding protein 1C